MFRVLQGGVYNYAWKELKSGNKSWKLAEWDWDSDEVVWISDIYELPVKGKGK